MNAGGARSWGPAEWAKNGGRTREKGAWLEGVPRIFGPTSKGSREDSQGLRGWRHGMKGEVFGALFFDHSPMAPPIVHPVKVSITAGYGPRHPSKGWCETLWAARSRCPSTHPDHANYTLLGFRVYGLFLVHRCLLF